MRRLLNLVLLLTWTIAFSDGSTGDIADDYELKTTETEYVFSKQVVISECDVVHVPKYNVRYIKKEPPVI